MSKTIYFVPERDSKGRFARAKRKIKRYFITFVIIGDLCAGYLAYQWHNTSLTFLREHSIASPLQVFAEQPEKTISLAEFNALVKKEQDAIMEELGQINPVHGSSSVSILPTR